MSISITIKLKVTVKSTPPSPPPTKKNTKDVYAIVHVCGVALIIHMMRYPIFLQYLIAADHDYIALFPPPPNDNDLLFHAHLVCAATKLLVWTGHHVLSTLILKMAFQLDNKYRDN